MSSRKARVDKLHAASISQVSTQIVVMQDARVLMKSQIGTNAARLVKIVIRF